MANFLRQVILEFGRPGATGKRFEDLAVSFRVTMTSSSAPHDAVIEARNLSADSVALLQRDDVVIRLLVGYDEPRLIFQGSPIKDGVEERLEGPTRVLRIQAQDGGREYRRTELNISYLTATTSGQVFDLVASELGLPRGAITLTRDIDYPQGVVLQGPARDVLDDLAEASNARWFITDGKLQVVPRDGAISERAVVFSAGAPGQAGNLIGSPARKDGGVEVTGLIAPSLRPGKPFRVRSEFITGDYVATRVEFRGGLRDTDFYVVAQGRPRRTA